MQAIWKEGILSEVQWRAAFSWAEAEGTTVGTGRRRRRRPRAIQRGASSELHDSLFRDLPGRRQLATQNRRECAGHSANSSTGRTGPQKPAPLAMRDSG